MSEEHPIMAMLLDHTSFVSGSAVVEDEIRPLDEQLNFGPGDGALLAASSAPLEADFTVGLGLDPSEHADEFPDWEERLLKSFVLCEIFSKSDRALSLGWVSRLKLLPISTEQYNQARSWLTDGFPEDAPDWCGEVYQTFTDKLHQLAPEVVPQAITCPNCQGREVNLKVTRTIIYTAPVGIITINGEDKLLPFRDPEQEGSHTAMLVCPDCSATATLEDDEWFMPSISN